MVSLALMVLLKATLIPRPMKEVIAIAITISISVKPPVARCDAAGDGGVGWLIQAARGGGCQWGRPASPNPEVRPGWGTAYRRRLWLLRRGRHRGQARRRG